MTLWRLLDRPAPCRPRPADDDALAGERNDTGLSGLIPIPEADAIAQALAAEPPPGANLADENPPAGSETINVPAN